MQGDIIGIVDASGNEVVKYAYDAWGKHLYTTGTLASTLGYYNPFRYREYIYDEETGLYYLRSRYYNPEWGRFLNADNIFGETGGQLCYNLYAYCKNSPIHHIDANGYSGIAIGGYIGYEAVKAILLGIFGLAGGRVAYSIGKESGKSINSSTITVLKSENEQPLPSPGPSPTKAPATTPTPPPIPENPGNDPGKAPNGYEWKGRGPQGSGQGNYYNPELDTSLHPDLNHNPPVEPHWDYWGPDKIKIRIFPK